MLRANFKITNSQGIHARPATSLVNVCMNYKSDISLKALKKTVDFKSIMGVMSLGIYSGNTIQVQVDGEDEVEAMKAIKDKIIELALGKEV